MSHTLASSFGEGAGVSVIWNVVCGNLKQPRHLCSAYSSHIAHCAQSVWNLSAAQTLPSLDLGHFGCGLTLQEGAGLPSEGGDAL